MNPLKNKALNPHNDGFVRASLFLCHDFVVSLDIPDKFWTNIGVVGHLLLRVP